MPTSIMYESPNTPLDKRDGTSIEILSGRSGRAAQDAQIQA